MVEFFTSDQPYYQKRETLENKKRLSMIKLLDLQAITAEYKTEIKEAVNMDVDSGWYLPGNEVKDTVERCLITR
jgi:hypothetical protein